MVDKTREPMELIGRKLKQASLLWLEGFGETCCPHRVVFLCFRSRKLLIRTGQCFLLNGFIILGSMFVLHAVVIPTLLWILPDQCSEIASQGSPSFANILKVFSYSCLGLIQLFYVFWFYPLYLFSFNLSTLWHNVIAMHGYAAMERNEPNLSEPSSKNEVMMPEEAALQEKPDGLGRIVIGIGGQVYSALLLSLFFPEAYATGFIPYVGKAINFVLLSWIYKWNLSEVALDRRLDLLKLTGPFSRVLAIDMSNIGNFSILLPGSPCVLVIFFFSPLVSYGAMAILVPLFVLTAAGQGLSNWLLLREGNGKAWDWEGLQYFMQ